MHTFNWSTFFIIALSLVCKPQQLFANDGQTCPLNTDRLNRLTEGPTPRSSEAIKADSEAILDLYTRIITICDSGSDDAENKTDFSIDKNYLMHNALISLRFGNLENFAKNAKLDDHEKNLLTIANQRKKNKSKEIIAPRFVCRPPHASSNLASNYFTPVDLKKSPYNRGKKQPPYTVYSAIGLLNMLKSRCNYQVLSTGVAARSNVDPLRIKKSKVDNGIKNLCKNDAFKKQDFCKANTPPQDPVPAPGGAALKMIPAS